MSCNVIIPIEDIVSEVLSRIDLSKYVTVDNGTANKLSLKNGVVLDTATINDFCQQLNDCFEDNYVTSFSLTGDTLEIGLKDGSRYQVSLAQYAKTGELAQAITDLSKQIVDGDKLLATNIANTERTLRDLITSGDKSLAEFISTIERSLRDLITSGDKANADNINEILRELANIREKFASDIANYEAKLTALEKEINEIAECFGCSNGDETVNNALITKVYVDGGDKSLNIKLADGTTFKVPGSQLATIL